MYNIDRDDKYTPSHSAAIHLCDLYGTGFTLPHVDVIANMPRGFSCDTCSEKCEPHLLRRCDGVFPVNAGITFPENAEGRHFACHRGNLCHGCEMRYNAAHKTEKYWLCTACRTPVTTAAAVWGSGILEPSYFRPPNTVAIMSLTSPSPFVLGQLEPDAVWQRHEADRHIRRIESSARRGGNTHTELSRMAAAEFLRLGRVSGITQGILGKMLRTLHDLHDKGLLIVGSPGLPGTLALPRDIRTLASRADGDVYQDRDVQYHTTCISQIELRQQITLVNTWRTDVLQIIQNLLLDPAYPDGAFFMQRRGDPSPEYTDERGLPLVGFEAYASTRWKKLIETIEPSAYLCCIALASDAVSVGDHSHYPFSIGIVNFPLVLRQGTYGSAKFGFAQKPTIRKPRGSKHHERLDPGQKDAKNALYSRIAAEMLGDLDYAARRPLHFLVRCLDGVTRSFPLQIRLHHAEQDCEEWTNCNGGSGKNCLDCLGVQHSMQAKKGGPGTRNRPFINLTREGCCATAKLRTPLGHLRDQARLMQMARSQGKTRANEEGRELRTRYRVPNALLRLTNLMPHGDCRGPFGVNGLDILHGLRTGVFDKLVKFTDNIVLKYFGKTKDVRTSEDVRDLMDSRLSQMGSWYGSVNFRMGFWGNGDGGGLKGHEVTALVRLLPFTIAGCPIMIQDHALRKKMLHTIWHLIRLLAEFETEQFYTIPELGDLQVRVTGALKGLHFLTDILQNEDGSNSCPGHGFDILKAHMLGGAVKYIEQFGSLRQIDTEASERSMGHLKDSDRLVGDRPAALLQRLASLQLDHSRASVSLRPPGVSLATTQRSSRLPTFGASRSAWFDNAQWSAVADDLLSGKNGPPVPQGRVESCLVDARRLLGLGEDDEFQFETQVSAPCHAVGVQYLVLRPGHCVQFKEGCGYYAQILIPRVILPRHVLVPGAATQALVTEFTPVSCGQALFPDIPVPWIKHRRIMLVSLASIAARVHVVPLFGNHYRQAGDINPHYLVNTSADECIAGPGSRRIFVRCSHRGCKALIPRPKNNDAAVIVICPLCKERKVWL